MIERRTENIISGFFRKRDERVQGYILSALDSLNSEGIVGASGFQIAKRDAELRHPKNSSWHMMGFGSLYPRLDQLVENGQLIRTDEKDASGEHSKFTYSRTNQSKPL